MDHSKVIRPLSIDDHDCLLRHLVPTDMMNAMHIVHSCRGCISQKVAEYLNGFFFEVALTSRNLSLWNILLGTTNMRVQTILSKLGAKDRTHAVTMGLRHGIIHLHLPELAGFLPNG